MTMSKQRVWILLAAAAILLTIGFLPLEQLSSAASRRQLRLSLVLAVGSAAIAVAIALPLAVVLTRIEIIGRRAAWFVLTLLLFAPLYVQLAGWDAVGGWLGWYGRNAPQAFLSGIAAATWVHGVAAVPWASVSCSPSTCCRPVCTARISPPKTMMVMAVIDIDSINSMNVKPLRGPLLIAPGALPRHAPRARRPGRECVAVAGGDVSGSRNDITHDSG